MGDKEEDMDFVGAFQDIFKFASPDNATKRLKSERKANLTARQRQQHRRRNPPKKQVNFRATAQTRALLDALSEYLTTTERRDVGQGEVVERALPLLAKSLAGFKEPK